ncbi:MAG: hypothetical protein ABSE53_08460 [Terracidiphilus sp.]
MKMTTMSTEFKKRAADALRALLGRVSAIKLMELEHESQPGGSAAAIRARIDIYGHSHTLACELNSNGEPAHLCAVFSELQSGAAPLAADTIPVVIAPYLSPEAQALCKQNMMGFLDFEGNARLTVGDFFIGMRSLPRQAATRVSAAPQKTPARAAADPIFPSALPKISPKQPAVALSA